MSEEKVNQIENEEKGDELSEEALGGVAGGKSYFGSRSNVASIEVQPTNPASPSPAPIPKPIT